MRLIALLSLGSSLLFAQNTLPGWKIQQVSISGILGQAINISKEGRLKNVIKNEKSPLLRIFTVDTAKASTQLGWKGEVAGKWMHTSALCLSREKDAVLEKNLLIAADFIVKNQWDDGYMGTFNDTNRFNGLKRRNNQTFDLWMCGYVIQGLTQVYQYKNDPKYLQASVKLADMILAYFMDNKLSVVNSGPFSGMASGAILEHFVDLYTLTKNSRYLEFSEYIVNDLEKRPGTELLTRFSLKYDVAQIGEGKMYEMIKCLVGLAKLQQIKKDPLYQKVLENAFAEITEFHLNAAGAPSGGLKIHPECFNYRYVFSPYFNTETCAMMDWIRLNKELWKIDHDGKYANMLEWNAYNALLGAQFPDGFTWQYHSHMNGKKERTGEDACCSSSGAVSLEEIAGAVVNLSQNMLYVNIYSPFNVSLIDGKRSLKIQLETKYPTDGKLLFKVKSSGNVVMKWMLHIPGWAADWEVKVNGKVLKTAVDRGYLVIDKEWNTNDVVEVNFPLSFYMEERKMSYTPEGYFNDNEKLYKCFYKGPLLYAASRKDEFKEQNPPVIPSNLSSLDVKVSGQNAEVIGSETYPLYPYYLVNDRKLDSYHAVWFLVK